MIGEALIKFSRRKGDLLEVKIKDITKRILYKEKCNISDKRKVALILGSLEKYGIVPEDMLKQILKNRKDMDKAMS